MDSHLCFVTLWNPLHSILVSRKDAFHFGCEVAPDCVRHSWKLFQPWPLRSFHDLWNGAFWQHAFLQIDFRIWISSISFWYTAFPCFVFPVIKRSLVKRFVGSAPQMNIRNVFRVTFFVNHPLHMNNRKVPRVTFLSQSCRSCASRYFFLCSRRIAPVRAH